MSFIGNEIWDDNYYISLQKIASMELDKIATSLDYILDDSLFVSSFEKNAAINDITTLIEKEARQDNTSNMSMLNNLKDNLTQRNKETEYKGLYPEDNKLHVNPLGKHRENVPEKYTYNGQKRIIEITPEYVKHIDKHNFKGINNQDIVNHKLYSLEQLTNHFMHKEGHDFNNAFAKASEYYSKNIVPKIRTIKLSRIKL